MVCAITFFLFFFFVPVVWTNILVCSAYGYGYSSLSYRVFYVGETYINGQFLWLTHGFSWCI
jgi:hypothetical protein